MRRGAFLNYRILALGRYVIKHLTHLEMLAHLFRNGAKSDTRKVIDGEARIFWIIQREHARAQCFDLSIRETFLERR